MLETLQKYWGYDAFRPLQEDIISSVLNQQDTLALLPTGGGKSICYQIPGLMSGGLTIVVTPLIALMLDQVDQLERRGIKAMAVHSGMRWKQIDIALDNAAYGDYKFLYVSPERLKTDVFRQRVTKMNVQLIAIDEAHCISQWGYDFRPAYLEIAGLRELIPSAPVIALTATATEQVVGDIADKLAFGQNHQIHKGSYFRPNLQYEVIHTENKTRDLLRLVDSPGESMIIYTRSRRLTSDLSKVLRENNIRAAYYHAGLSHEQRQDIQKRWIDGETDVMVATNAFGMGIDKPDVRKVIHIMPPDNLEAYVQEAGRAGRDGKPSRAILLVGSDDGPELEERVLKNFPDQEIIRRAYLALSNFFRVPIGAGRDELFTIRLLEFCKKSGFKYVDLINSLKILQSNGYLTLSESILSPSTVQLKLASNELYQFQLNHPKLDPLIKLILRSHTGIFDRAAKINENRLAKKLTMSRPECIGQLRKLHELEVIEYTESSNLPLIRFEEDRINEEHLRFDPKTLRDRKSQAQERVTHMRRYFEQDICRNQMILAYFSEESEPCGICDVCLSGAKVQLPKGNEELSLEQSVRQALMHSSLSIDELTTQINHFEAIDVIQFVRKAVDEKVIVYRNGMQLVWSGE